MEKEIYDRLPLDAQQLVDKIEIESGIEIAVAAAGTKSFGDVQQPFGESVVGVITGPTSIVIESPTTIDAITEDDYIHELLHLDRMYVSRIPHLYAKKTTNGNVSASIDNWLEHAVIYGKHIQIDDAYREKLSEGMIEFWGKAPWGLADGPIFRFNLLSRYVITRLHANRAAKSEMNAAIARLRLPYRIGDVGKRCEKLLGDKRALVKSVLAFCDIPKGLFWLRHYEKGRSQAVWYEI